MDVKLLKEDAAQKAEIKAKAAADKAAVCSAVAFGYMTVWFTVKIMLNNATAYRTRRRR